MTEKEARILDSNCIPVLEKAKRKKKESWRRRQRKKQDRGVCVNIRTGVTKETRNLAQDRERERERTGMGENIKHVRIY